MKILFTLAALAATTAYTGMDVKFQTVGSPGSDACAKRLIGRDVVGVGVIRLASPDPQDGKRYIVRIEGHGAASSGQPSQVDMRLTQEQLCDFADSLEDQR